MRKAGIVSTLALLAGFYGQAALADAPKINPPPDFFKITLMQTWESNPELRSARSALDQAREEINYARSYWGPSASGTAGIVSRHSYPDSFGSASGETKTLQLEVVQPVYRGGKTVSATAAAQSRVNVATENLHAAEQRILLEAATAYMDILRDAEIVRLHESNEKVLERQRDAAKTRFDLGDVSKTDVSQAEARLAEAHAAKIKADGNLKQTQAAFEKLSGAKLGGALVRPVLAFSIPATLDDALALSESGNPEILKAVYENEAEKHDTRTLVGEILPEVNLTGTGTRTYNPTFGNADQQDNATVELKASIPLFSSGRAGARIRQARLQENQSRIDIETKKRAIREQTIAAWEDLAAGKAGLEARKAQVQAAQEAFDGMEQEAKLGSRTTLDLLDSEQELLDAQTALVGADRDVTVSFFRLLSAMGELTGEALGLAAFEDELKTAAHYDNDKKNKVNGEKGAN